MGREIRDCLELLHLRKDALACTFEPKEAGPDEQNYTNDLSPFAFEPGRRMRDEPGSEVRNEPGGQVGLDEFCTNEIYLNARSNPRR